MFLIALFALSSSSIHIHGAAVAQRQLAVKQYECISDSIAFSANDFLFLAQHSKVFVDNSILIDDILKTAPNDRLFLWAGPSGWGKSINLSMLKLFFQVQLDENGTEIYESSTANKLFAMGEVVQKHDVEQLQAPLLIAQKQATMNTYLGKSPVLYLTFKDIKYDEDISIKDQLQSVISNLYKQYEFIHPRVKLNDVVRFEEYLNGTNWVDLKDSLKFLSKILYQEYVGSQSIVILIDDYDAPIIDYLHNPHPLDNDLNDAFKFLIDLVPSTFQSSSAKKYLLCGIISCKFKFEYHKYGRELYVVDKNDTLSEYFGFSETLVKALFEEQQINKQLRPQALQWYGGYTSYVSKQNYYNPYSIARFLNERKLSTYFRDGRHEFLVQAMKRHPQTIDCLLSLLSQQTVSVPSHIQFKFQYEPQLKQIFYENVHQTQFDREMFLMYLLAEGYLTRVPYSDQAKIPNLELSIIIVEQLILHYRREYRLKQNLLRDVAVALRDTIRTNTTTLEDPYTTLIQNVRDRLPRKKQNQPILAAIFNAVSLQTQAVTKFVISATYFSTFNTTVVLFKDKKFNTAVIVQMIHNATVHEAFEFADSYDHILQKSDKIRSIKLIAINVSLNGTVTALQKPFAKQPTVHKPDAKAYATKLVRQFQLD